MKQSASVQATYCGGAIKESASIQVTYLVTQRSSAFRFRQVLWWRNERVFQFGLRYSCDTI